MKKECNVYTLSMHPLHTQPPKHPSTQAPKQAPNQPPTHPYQNIRSAHTYYMSLIFH